MMLPPLSSSPSFSSYSSETLAQIAARVIHELSTDPHYNNLDDTHFASPWSQNDNNHRNTNDNDDAEDNQDDEEDFEFALVSTDSNSSPVSADDIFHNGQIIPTYPLFGRNLNDAVSVSKVPSAEDETAGRKRRLPLRKLMSEERETGLSKDGNELKGVDEGSYCVWTPQQFKKSDSAGSSSSSSNSKRWRIRVRDMLLRSQSDGKEPILVVGHTKNKRSNKVAPKRRGGGAGSASTDNGARIAGGALH